MVKFIQFRRHHERQSGQALIEYALIFALLAIALAVALAATGPAIANVFSNVICNVAGQQRDCNEPLEALDQFGASDNFWQTVTWVAANPQQETPFPTQPLVPPTAADVTLVGGLNTAVPTDTPPPTAPLLPTNVPADSAFPILNESGGAALNNWRLDNSVWLGYKDWWGRYFPNTTFGGSPTVTIRNYDAFGVSDALNINRDWGTGRPLTNNPNWGLSDSYSIRFTREVEAPSGSAALRFSLSTDTDDGSAALWVCPSEADAISRNTTNCTQIINWTTGASNVYTLTGTQWLLVDYIEQLGNSAVRLDVTRAGAVNPDDVVPTGGECKWGTIENNNSNTRTWMFDENPTSDNWPSNQTCYLELRGWMDIASVTNPALSFWDVWDLPAGVTAVLQVADYDAVRANMNWRTVTVRTGATNNRNYEWTRNQVRLSSITPALTSNRIAVRFGLSSTTVTTGSTTRWYLDDIQLVSSADSTVTMNQRWDLNSSTQANDFITSGRWALTTTRVRSGMSWEDSPGTTYAVHSQGGPRIHYLEPRGLVDLTSMPTADFEGDEGLPVLTLWHAYQISAQTRLLVQYTRDARDATPDTWTTITGTEPAPSNGTVVHNTGTTLMSSLVYQRVQVRLDTIPNYNTQPFRLRLAMEVPATPTTTGDGWWIDDLSIDRYGADRFTAYPFTDHAESTTFTTDHWLGTGGWASATGTGALINGNPTSRFYTDSPSGDYAAGVSTSFELQRWLDLRYDSVANTANPSGVGEPLPGTSVITARQSANARPVLSFWHTRAVQAGTTLQVQVSASVPIDGNISNQWRTVWSYASGSSNPGGLSTWNQTAYQRVEIDMRRAIELAYSTTWSTLSSNTETRDDDIKIRFVLTTGATAADGFQIDGIRLEDVPMQTVNNPRIHLLWNGAATVESTSITGEGNTYTDEIDSSVSPFGSIGERWYLDGGSWRMVAENGSNGDVARSLVNSLRSSEIGVNYGLNQVLFLEMSTIIDLRGAVAADAPAISFFQRYATGDDDSINFQVSASNASATTQGLDRVAGWDAWTTVNLNTYYDEQNAEWVTRTGWQRIQVNLSTYVGRQIKVRWVINGANSTAGADGMFIDDVRFFFNRQALGFASPLTTPYLNEAQSMGGVLADGNWGLAPDWWRGETDLPSSMGSSPWIGRWFNASMQSGGSEGCWFDGQQTTMQRLWPAPGTSATTVPGLAASVTNPLLTTLNTSNYQVVTGTTIREDVNGVGPNQGLLPDASYKDCVMARFMRAVTLSPGTYVIQAQHDDDLRIYINNNAGTNVPSGNLIYSGSYTGNLQTRSFTVTSATPIQRVLYFDYAEQGGGANLFLNLGRLRTSYTDSPNQIANPPAATTNTNNNQHVIQQFLTNSRTSLMINGYFDTSAAVMSAPRLAFYWMARQNSSRLSVDFSTDGGFTWSTASTTAPFRSWETTSTFTPLTADWNRQVITLPASTRLMIRFRFTTGSNNADGVYITDIEVFNQ